ncbi:EF-hand calcium-binding domain-containing protein 6-like [Pseudophryne corroboree]|uniref:EF-hand calcium-binding domain-containing protein 6-like n=1 Tax=Pseudophryne corroboree TaxID=495146 RepID=UPI0030814690
MAGLRAKSLCGTHSKLPDIQHPGIGLGDPDSLTVRAISRAGEWEEALGSHRGSGYKKSAPQRNLNSNRGKRQDGARQSGHVTDIDKKHWERRGEENEKEEPWSNKSSRLDAQCEELEFQLLEKINSGGFYDLKRLFVFHDPEGRGRVKRGELLVILSSFLGQFINKQVFQHLLDRLHLEEKPIITFDALYEHFKPVENKKPPDWLDPVKRNQKVALKTAREVHLELKEMANNRYYELLKLFRKDCVNASEFQSALSKLGIRMTEEEFKKLWRRYVRDDTSVLGVESLQHQLGTKHQRLDEDRSLLLSALRKVSGSRNPQQINTTKIAGSNARRERKLSLSIEKWLKEKFREGARAMMAEFLVYDPQRTCRVLKEDFLNVLEKFQLHLTKDQLGHFLARCGLDETLPHVNYQEFLQCLQTRGKNGRAHKVFCKPGYSTYRTGDEQSTTSASTTSVLQGKLATFLHTDFYALFDEFRKADTYKVNVISQQDFRSILERRYCMKVTDEEFSYLLEKFPRDHHGGIRYPEFMAKFDSSEGNLSLWNGNETVLTECTRKPKATATTADHGKRLPAAQRSAEQLAAIIRRLVKHDYQALELNFSEMDDMNTRRLTAEGLYRLLKRCDIRPEVSREEVGKIWKTLILNQDETADFFQFVRHFGFSVNSSCFPNAKVSPPVRGDSDCFLRSLKLNSDTKIIANILQSKLQLFSKDLQAQFKELDPQNSGCVSVEEFLDILQDLSPALTQHQCDTIIAKCAQGQNRVSYTKFLQPYQNGTSAIKEKGGKELSSEGKMASPRESVDRGLNTVTSKLRQKLSSTELRNLYEACQKLDTNGSGFLQLPEFRAVLKLCNIVLEEDDIYHKMPHYNKDLTGKIDYSQLVSRHSKKK